MGYYYKHDPGPCPVDDAPHHTCVGPTTTTEIAVIQLPARDGVKTPRATQTYPANATPGAWTTATYRRRPR